MSTKFTEYKGLDLPKVAEEILDYWNTENIFEKSISSREGNKPFVFFEGPPSANGLPGVHHVLARAIKDIFPRYKTMKGFQVKRKAGWDTHGLPVELGVEKELGIKLTESLAMWPGAAVSGYYFGNPEARYFGLGKITDDQVRDFALRKGISLEKARKWLHPNIAEE